MRKIFISTLIFAGILVALPAFAVDYSRTPSGYTIENPVTFEAPKPTDTCGSAQSWRLRCLKPDFTEIFSDECLAWSVEDGVFVKTLPISEYIQVATECYVNSNCTTWKGRTPLEYDSGATIFEVVAPPPPVSPGVHFIPSGSGNAAASGTLAYTKDMWASLNTAIFLIVGFLFGFWLIDKVISTIGKPMK